MVALGGGSKREGLPQTLAAQQPSHLPGYANSYLEADLRADVQHFLVMYIFSYI